MKKILEFKKVSKSFGEQVALKDVSFDVEKGEFIFLTGPSGAGKTTIIRLILGQIAADEGEIIFEDENIADVANKDIPKLRQKIGVVFQDFKVLPESTVEENVEVALAVIGLPKDDWEARIEHVLGLVGLDGKGKMFPAQLSGGELQRLSLARALVVNPKILLADEPTGNLDWDTAEKIMDLIAAINKEGKTVIVATHHELIVKKYGKRVIRLEEGKMAGSKKEEGKKKK